ncbi:GNAT family N-acetyltransferase [Bradyrhizobium sp. SZCCHNS3055]|uniref:GNAT family N-acetyltransferase n=1 Tax=Bradyrhizobium sp. SZCCHNS3055 TaxID=3057323 RepID=UPI0028E48577|nr:GNAT family N-acetyltransferase [Bradyrhizobium sp. SZCCHNS3055]
MAADLAHRIAEAYRWQRRLGNTQIEAPGCHLVVNPAHPDVWDSNHADEVTARTDAEIDAVFAAMDRHLSHTVWRVIHTDCFTPDAFLARLALDDFEERPVTIQMALQGDLANRDPAIELRPVIRDVDWDILLQLVLADHAEGRRTSNSDVPPEVSDGIVAGYRAKSGTYHFHLAMQNGVPIAYGAHAAAPNGVGMIEDLFTLQSVRRRGIASAIIATFTERLHAAGCHTVFLGALATEQPKRLYARLGFKPVMLARTWVRRLPRDG